MKIFKLMIMVYVFLLKKSYLRIYKSTFKMLIYLIIDFFPH